MPQAGDLRTRRKHLLRVPSSPVPRRGNTSFALLDRARPVCLRPKSRRFAAVGLRHAPAGAVSFSSGKKNWGPRAACRVGRGGRNGAERSPRPRRGRSGRSFFQGKLGPRAACRVGRGGRNGAERSPRPRRGRSGRSFFRRHGGCNEPAIAGIQSAPPEGRATFPAL